MCGLLARDVYKRQEISLDAIGREDGSYGLSEETGVVTAVVTYHYRKAVSYTHLRHVLSSCHSETKAHGWRA